MNGSKFRIPGINKSPECQFCTTLFVGIRTKFHYDIKDKKIWLLGG